MNAKSFFEFDFNSTLFPLKTNLLLIKHHHVALEAYINKILSDDPSHVSDNFLPQARVYAAKPRNHLRRTVVLDPVATYFLYDIIYRNRAAFGKKNVTSRKAFGYQFNGLLPITVHKSYLEFSEQVALNRKIFEHSISFDVASYFNSIYHHDATNWFSSLDGVTGIDTNAFGRFFREINSGRSIDFLPQGIYPAKMIGNEFLNFIEASGQIKSAQLLRFMDDIYLFDNSEEILTRDFLRIQELLGLRALNVNPSKTAVDAEDSSVQEVASAIQEKLQIILEDREGAARFLGSGVEWSDYEDEDEVDETVEPLSLDKYQVDQLLEMLLDPRADESEVEIILGILTDHTEIITSHIPLLLARYPNIIKHLHRVAGLISDKEQLTTEIINLVTSSVALIEYQLFWIAVIAEDHLSNTKNFGPLILKLYERTAEHKIARAKILEIPDQSFGLKEIRDEILKSGASDWPSWAAAVGTRSLKKAERNYALKYFSKGSPLNYLISECVQKLP